MYDSIIKGTIDERNKAVRDPMAVDFSLAEVPFYVDNAECRKLLPTGLAPPNEETWFGARLHAKGVPEEDIAFLVEILNPDPNERLSAEEIIRSGYLDRKRD
jgi:protein kinase